MNDFFSLNSENRIGYKLLTKTDLGMKETNNVTHIGLKDGVLTFLADKDVVKSAILVYNNYCDILSCSFDRISRNYGEYNSPKIKKGGRNTDNVVSKIREFANQKPNSNWLLVWFGLDSEEMVFWLIREGSNEYNQAKNFFPKNTGILTENSPSFPMVVSFLNNKINMVSENLQMDLEITSQIGESGKSIKAYKNKDIEKASIRFKEVGLLGENLVNQYLEKEKMEGKIKTLNWVNKSRESGLPYDFIIDGRKYIDVKSTSFDFNQYLYFSSQEIDFISHKSNPLYSVFRVYDIFKDMRKLRICRKCAAYMSEINKPIQAFNNCLSEKQAIVKTIKVGIKPNDCFSEIQNPLNI